jgi:prepilin-type N-terminal cleavage/methylation domain-containing protein
VVRRRQAGYTLLELTVAMAIFSIFLATLFVLTLEMYRYEKRLPVNFMKNPQVIGVIARLRRDVQDAHTRTPYLETHDGFTMSSKTLILRTVSETGGEQIVVWDFTTPGEVLRRSHNVGVKSDWRARGVPASFSQDWEFDAVKIGNSPYGVRIQARDERGRLAIDQILQPRTKE